MTSVQLMLIALSSGLVVGLVIGFVLGMSLGKRH